MMDEGQIKFTPAVGCPYIKPKTRNTLRLPSRGEVAAPSLSQAQRMRNLDQKGRPHGDVIDFELSLKDKKEVDKVILTGCRAGKNISGKETTPREM